MAKMTAKQRRFCDEYLIDLNATQAAIRAGYSKKTAYSIGDENLNKPEIKEFIAKRMAAKDAELIANQDEVLQYLTAVMRGVSTAEVVVVEGFGNGCSEARSMMKSPDEKERLRPADKGYLRQSRVLHRGRQDSLRQGKGSSCLYTRGAFCG